MSASIPKTDILRPFQLEASQLRGRIVRLGSSLDRVLNAHDYPDNVSSLLAELLVLAGGLAGGLKYEGTFSLQVRGDGPVRLMVADMRNHGEIRGYASYDETAIDGGLGLSALVGSGVLAITVDQRPTGGEVYQGVVELDGRSLQESMLRYFHQSEQVPTGIVTAVRRDVDGWIGSAIIVQAMPGSGGQAAVEREDDWRRAMVLMQSAEDDELLNPTLPVDRLLFRLFHEDGVRVFDELIIRFGCTCDESRVRNVLAQFAADEFETMRGEDGLVHVKCEFCSEVYKFDDAAIREIIQGTVH